VRKPLISGALQERIAPISLAGESGGDGWSSGLRILIPPKFDQIECGVSCFRRGFRLGFSEAGAVANNTVHYTMPVNAEYL
jgi:hypothetical protein